MGILSQFYNSPLIRGNSLISHFLAAILFVSSGSALAHPDDPDAFCLTVFDVADAIDWAVKNLDEVSNNMADLGDSWSKLPPDRWLKFQDLVVILNETTVRQLHLIGSYLEKCKDMAFVRPIE